MWEKFMLLVGIRNEVLIELVIYVVVYMNIVMLG